MAWEVFGSEQQGTAELIEGSEDQENDSSKDKAQFTHRVGERDDTRTNSSLDDDCDWKTNICVGYYLLAFDSGMKLRTIVPY